MSCKRGESMDGFHSAVRLLPPELERAARALPEDQKCLCEEFRLRAGQLPSILLNGREYVLSSRPVEREVLRCVLETATRSSFHAQTEALRRGFAAAEGGVRVGLCGTAVSGPNGLEGLTDFSSLSIRVPRAVPGCADGIWPALMEGGFLSVLILSPPGAGKTTLLRELVRKLSESGYRVAVADERREIAAFSGNGFGFNVGRCTDVMTGVQKAEAVGMFLRAMNPQIIAVDEITDPRDVEALREAAGCGVALLATIHATVLDDLALRPAGRKVLESGMFSRCVIVKNRDGRRSYAVEAVS